MNKKLLSVLLILIVGSISGAIAYNAYYSINDVQNSATVTPNPTITASPIPLPYVTITHGIGSGSWHYNSLSGPLTYRSSNDIWFSMPPDTTLLIIGVQIYFTPGYSGWANPKAISYIIENIDHFYIIDNGKRLEGNYTNSISGVSGSVTEPGGADGQVACLINGYYTLSSNYSLACDNLPVAVNWG
jgi:hypothetical protein